MPSALVKNDNVEFLVAKDFVWNTHHYRLGEEFDQNVDIGRIELLVRTRRIIPVVESTKVKPRMFHREVRIKSEVMAKLGLVDDLTEEVPEEETVEVESTPDADIEVVQEDGEYDPANHKVEEVVEYVRAHPGEAASIYEMEEQGKNRSTLLTQLGDIINEEDLDV